jgi:hypothetical protein
MLFECITADVKSSAERKDKAERETECKKEKEFLNAILQLTTKDIIALLLLWFLPISEFIRILI